MVEGSQRAILAAMLANLGLAIAKFVAFLATGASSMLAESIHSVADTGNQGLLFWGGSRARREPTAEHAFGFGRERYFWAFIVALVLFSLGAVFAIYEGLHKLRHPEPLARMGWAIGVLLGVIAIVIAIEMKSLLIGESATLATSNEIEAALESHPGVHRVIHLRTQHMGPDQLLVAAKVEFDVQLTVADLARVIDEAEVRARERVPIAVRIYLEPDLHREAEAVTSP